MGSGFASTLNVQVLNSYNPELQLKGIESAIKSKLIELLTQLKGFKFVKAAFEKIEIEDKGQFDSFYLNSKVEVAINESDTDDVLQSANITNIKKCLEKCSGQKKFRTNVQEKVQEKFSLIILLVFQNIILQLEVVI